MELQGKKVLVFGSGKSGIGASDLLAKVGAFPVIYDGNAETDKDAVVHKTDGTYPVTVYAGELPKEVQDSLDLVVLSPGSDCQINRKLLPKRLKKSVKSAVEKRLRNPD